MPFLPCFPARPAKFSAACQPTSVHDQTRSTQLRSTKPIVRPVLIRLPMLAILLASTSCGQSPQPRNAPPNGAAVSSSAGLPSTLQTRRQGSDWPRMLGPGGDGKSPEKGIRTDWSNGKLPLVWSRDLGTSYGMAVVSQGRLFQFDRFDNVERLQCLNSETGQPLWNWDGPVEYRDMYGYNNGPRCGPVVDQDRVYVYGVAGQLACLNVSDGKLIWKRQINEEFGVIPNFFGVGSVPIIYQNLLILNVGGSPPEDQSLPNGRIDLVSGNGSGVVALNKLTGETVYQFSDELASYSSPVLAQVDGRDWCFLFARGGLIGWNPAQDKPDFFFPWRSTTMESVNAASPIVYNDEVLISETYGPASALLKIKPGNFELLRKDGLSRKDQSFRAHWATPIVVEGYLYGCSGRNQPDADLRCVRWSDGKVMWANRNHQRTSLTYIDGHFIVLDENGLVQLIKANPEKLEVITELDLSDTDAMGGKAWLLDPCWAAPIVSHGLLYIRGANRLVCFELIPQPK